MGKNPKAGQRVGGRADDWRVPENNCGHITNGLGMKSVAFGFFPLEKGETIVHTIRYAYLMRLISPFICLSAIDNGSPPN